VRVAEIHLEAGVDAELGVLRQLGALVPGQGYPQLFGQGGDGGGDRVSDRLGAVPGERRTVVGPGAAVVWHARQVQQHGEAGGPFDQSAVGGALKANNEVALPVPRDGPVGTVAGRGVPSQFP
jgi:hypothetical protein